MDSVLKATALLLLAAWAGTVAYLSTIAWIGERAYHRAQAAHPPTRIGGSTCLD